MNLVSALVFFALGAVFGVVAVAGLPMLRVDSCASLTDYGSGYRRVRDVARLRGRTRRRVRSP